MKSKMKNKLREPFYNLLWKASVGYYDWDQINPEVLEKFAKLIVEECCEVIANDCEMQFNQGILSNLGGLNQAKGLIKQHFRVE